MLVRVNDQSPWLWKLLLSRQEQKGLWEHRQREWQQGKKGPWKTEASLQEQDWGIVSTFIWIIWKLHRWPSKNCRALVTQINFYNILKKFSLTSLSLLQIKPYFSFNKDSHLHTLLNYHFLLCMREHRRLMYGVGCVWHLIACAWEEEAGRELQSSDTLSGTWWSRKAKCCTAWTHEVQTELKRRGRICFNMWRLTGLLDTESQRYILWDCTIDNTIYITIFWDCTIYNLQYNY